MVIRILLLACMASCLSSCGTATHMIGQASGLLNTVVAPVTGILRLSDSEESASSPLAAKSEKYTPPVTHDGQRTETERQH